LPVCSSGQAIGYDGGWGCIPASAGKAYLPLAANGVLTNSTATVVGGAWIDFSQYSTLTCRFEFSGSTTDTNAVLSAQLYDLTDLDGGTPLSVSSLATLKAVSGTLSLPQTGKQYEVRAWLADAGPTSTGNLLTAMIRCE